MLVDSFGRKINYLRLAVTDRCNLRCFYCMPESGINYAHRKDLLTFEEMERLSYIFSELGVTKIRITGGEPFVRKGIMEFLYMLKSNPKIEEINITTNGTAVYPFLPELEKMGIYSVNLSLDTLNAKRFFDITRRPYFNQVEQTLHYLFNSNFKVKINMVVMAQKNTQDIYDMLSLAENHPVSVRFIEEMPFNGSQPMQPHHYWDAQKILQHIQKKYAVRQQEFTPASTSVNYTIDGFIGNFGIIAAYTRSFCGTCNRIRLTPKGEFKLCLYSDGGFSFRDFLRSGVSDDEIKLKIKALVLKKPKDGFEAEKSRNPEHPVSESMATIGG